MDTDTHYRWVYYPGRVGPHIHTEAKGAPVRVRIQLSGLQPVGDRAPHLTVWDFVLKRSVFDEDIVASEDKPIIIDFVTTAYSFQILNDTKGSGFAQHTLNMTRGHLVSSTDRRGQHPTGYMLFDDDGEPIYPLLLIDWIEYESVPVSEANLAKRKGLVPDSVGQVSNLPSNPQQAQDLLQEVREYLQRLATRAWRRPVTGVEVTRYLMIVEDELAAGAPFPAAYRAAMVGVLTSKNFYYITEGSASGLQIVLLVKVFFDCCLPFPRVAEVVSFTTNLFVEPPARGMITQRKIGVGPVPAVFRGGLSSKC